MEAFLEFLGLGHLDFVEKNRLLMSFFCFLTFIILFYFFNLSKKNSQAKKENSFGLLALACTFVFYFLLGLFSANEAGTPILVLFSGAINVCILLSIPFFSQGETKIDKLLSIKIWRYAAGAVILLYLFQYFNKSALTTKFVTDDIISILSILTLGIVLVRYLVIKELHFLGLLCAIVIAFIAGLQFFSSDILGQGKFVHVNTAILSPALFLSIIAVSITFNWINELNFSQVAMIYSENPSQENSKPRLQNAEEFKKSIANEIGDDNIEKVIEMIINQYKRRNKSLEIILLIAAHNSRNNTNRLKGIITDEDYNINRAKVINNVLELVNGK